MYRSSGVGHAVIPASNFFLFPMKLNELSVTVTPRYLPDQSSPDQHRYVFAYTVRILNVSAQPVQIVSRHWIITDATQAVREVRGLGIVGEQPVLEPGQTFEYTSGCPLATPVGSMRGFYHCVGEDGIPFDAAIPEFVLAVPRTLH